MKLMSHSWFMARHVQLLISWLTVIGFSQKCDQAVMESVIDE